jgi:hypothetical protein
MTSTPGGCFELSQLLQATRETVQVGFLGRPVGDYGNRR